MQNHRTTNIEQMAVLVIVLVLTVALGFGLLQGAHYVQGLIAHLFTTATPTQWFGGAL